MDSERADYIVSVFDEFLYDFNRDELSFDKDNPLYFIIEPEYIYDGSKLVIIVRE